MFLTVKKFQIARDHRKGFDLFCLSSYFIKSKALHRRALLFGWQILSLVMFTCFLIFLSLSKSCQGAVKVGFFLMNGDPKAEHNPSLDNVLTNGTPFHCVWIKRAKLVVENIDKLRNSKWWARSRVCPGDFIQE